MSLDKHIPNLRAMDVLTWPKIQSIHVSHRTCGSALEMVLDDSRPQVAIVLVRCPICNTRLIAYWSDPYYECAYDLLSHAEVFNERWSAERIAPMG